MHVKNTIFKGVASINIDILFWGKIKFCNNPHLQIFKSMFEFQGLKKLTKLYSIFTVKMSSKVLI